MIQKQIYMIVLITFLLTLIVGSSASSKIFEFDHYEDSYISSMNKKDSFSLHLNSGKMYVVLDGSYFLNRLSKNDDTIECQVNLNQDQSPFKRFEVTFEIVKDGWSYWEKELEDTSEYFIVSRCDTIDGEKIDGLGMIIIKGNELDVYREQRSQFLSTYTPFWMTSDTSNTEVSNTTSETSEGILHYNFGIYGLAMFIILTKIRKIVK